MIITLADGTTREASAAEIKRANIIARGALRGSRATGIVASEDGAERVRHYAPYGVGRRRKDGSLGYWQSYRTSTKWRGDCYEAAECIVSLVLD